MKKIKSQIFNNIDDDEYKDMLLCGFTRTEEYQKDDIIFRMGSEINEFGVVISGKIYIENIDLWGNRMILHEICEGGIFAETYAFCNSPMMVDVVCMEKCEILFININILLSTNNGHKSWYNKMLYNLFVLSSQKNLAWSNRMFCISSKNIRNRVMNYLSSQAIKTGKNEIIIPFNRQQMADYLNVERSALSKELGKMKKDGLIDYKKNCFYIYNYDCYDFDI